MATTHTISRPDAVIEALHREDLVPPPMPETVGEGTLARLRASMARFRSGADHVGPRGAVERAIARIEPAVLHRHCAEGTWAALTDPVVDGLQLARRIPAESLALALASPDPEAATVAAQTQAVVDVIGRGAPTTPAAEAAAEALLDRFAAHPEGAVAAVSLLYQVVDATAALILLTLASAPGRSQGTHAAAGGRPDAGTGGWTESGVPLDRPSALAGTVRVATAAAAVGDVSVAKGDTVRLAFGDQALEFGAGPHRCPGVDLARTITNAVVDTIVAAGYRPRAVVADDDGRPTELALVAAG